MGYWDIWLEPRVVSEVVFFIFFYFFFILFYFFLPHSPGMLSPCKHAASCMKTPTAACEQAHNTSFSLVAPGGEPLCVASSFNVYWKSYI